MNRAQFLARLRKLADELETDHEEHTGITVDETMLFEHWLYEIQSLHENMKDAE